MPAMINIRFVRDKSYKCEMQEIKDGIDQYDAVVLGEYAVA